MLSKTLNQADKPDLVRMIRERLENSIALHC
jgi:hypothetical protein